MTNEYALKIISSKVRKELSNESEEVRNYIVKQILSDFNIFERADNKYYNSRENLDYAIEITLYSGALNDLLQDARKETM